MSFCRFTRCVEIVAASIGSAALCAGSSIDLAGDWRLALDGGDRMIHAAPASWKFDDRMELPGTTDLAKKGKHVSKARPFEYHLSREWEFTGPAYYARSISIPEDWRGREVVLFLERVMWQSRVWVDGIEASGPHDSLNTPHLHDLGVLEPGAHELVIRVDNRMIHPIGDKGHAYGPQTQSLWNGIVGKIELRSLPATRIDRVRIFPSNDGTLRIEAHGHGSGKLELKAACIDPESGDFETTASFAKADLRSEGAFETTIEGRLPFQPLWWSEFSPKLYQLRLTLSGDGGAVATHDESFGFREISHDGKRLLLNGRPAFMRGNLECAVFPKTGHPPVTVDEWKRIWRVYQEHQLNHARFHSWCPPEAAFIAADQMGIYLQVEAPIWMDHWMKAPNARPEMDTPGYPQGLGKGDRSNDAFARSEIQRTIDTYGNHPSFLFFAIGNELGTSDFGVTGTWIRDAKMHDPRHLYAASTARTITPFCDYNATHNIPGIGRTRQHLEFGTAWDYEDVYQQASVPIIAHEIGQWPVYVDWRRALPKYTGPLKPYRLEELAEAARATGVYARAAAYEAASGASNRILYRDEIESFLRTPSCRGFQLLNMQDFTGQGEALVGWLDPFYESKGTTSPAEFRRYCAPTVPLLGIPGRVFRGSERPLVHAMLHHYGADALEGVVMEWKLGSKDGRVMDSGTFPVADFPTGEVTAAGSFKPDFSPIERASELVLSLSIRGSTYSNDYAIWVYPDGVPAEALGGVVVAADWQSAKSALADGKPVVLIADRLGGSAATRLAHWVPLYWSVPFFPGQARDTLGLLVHREHPAFASFPTPGFGDWNWFRICKGARGFDLTDIAGLDFVPIAEPVPDFHLNRRLGSIFEAKVGGGRLLVCGYDIGEETARSQPETAQLRRSLLDYAAGPSFSPQASIPVEALDRLFADPDYRPTALPEEFAGSDLCVHAAGKLAVSGEDVPWNRGDDEVLRQVGGVDYRVEADGVWRDETGTAWHGKKLTVTLTPRAGVAGKVLVRFHDWNGNGRSGAVRFEEQTRQLGLHPDGVWLEFPFIREDTNDSRLILSAEAIGGPNLMITDLVIIPDE